MTGWSGWICNFTVTLPIPNGELKFQGGAFLKSFSLPNFFFHCTMTYALLRQGGVDLGKGDYLGPIFD